ncbi:MAG TPA: class I tRNA ligase family protein, partial [Gammaproteobacteria bacterium]|nr:class I tRNA ligase family protein [Gammaproteobacteria bacterium]
DFQNRINADLIGKWINIASRSSKFIRDHFENCLSEDIDDDLLEIFNNEAKIVKGLYQKRELGQSMRKIMLLADKANQYLDQEKPWIMIKDDNEKENVQKVCTNALNMFLKLTIMLKPVMPEVAKNVESFMNLSDLNWSNISDVIKDHKINDYENLLTRIREEDIERIIKK